MCFTTLCTIVHLICRQFTLAIYDRHCVHSSETTSTMDRIPTQRTLDRIERIKREQAIENKRIKREQAIENKRIYDQETKEMIQSEEDYALSQVNAFELRGIHIMAP
jgi:uncharacterized protein (UPF0276 family)